MSTPNEYIPGVCNIGPAEVRLRRALGWAGLAVTAVLWAALAAFGAAPAWRLVTFVPAAASATGFLQATWHFCAKFGLGGVFNFGPTVGQTDAVEQAEYRRQDRRTAVNILALSALLGGIVAAVAFFLPI